MASPSSIPVKKTNFKSIQLNKVKVEVESDSDSEVQVFAPLVPSVASPGRSSVAAGQSTGPKPPRAPIRFGLLPVLSGGNATQISNLKKKPRDPNNNSKGGKRNSQDGQSGSASSNAKGVEGEENGASAVASLPVQTAPSTLPNNQLVPTNSRVSLIVKESRVVKGRLQPVQPVPAAASDHSLAVETMILPLVEARRENEVNMEKNKGRIRRLEDDVDRLNKDKQRLEKDMDGNLKRSMARREDRLDRQMNLLEKRLLCVEKGERKRKERKRGGSDSDEARHGHKKSRH